MSITNCETKNNTAAYRYKVHYNINYVINYITSCIPKSITT